MKFHDTELADARLIEPERRGDERGYFARVACAAEFAAAGIEADYPQASVSHNLRAGTLRGMHFQRAPHAEAKLVRVTRGAVWDVIIDLRPESPSFIHIAFNPACASSNRRTSRMLSRTSA